MFGRGRFQFYYQGAFYDVSNASPHQFITQGTSSTSGWRHLDKHIVITRFYLD